MTWNFGLDFGSALGGFVGLLGANASSKSQYKYQSRLQEQAARLNYEYGLKSLENSPTSQRTGLESAGYNPMLAVQNATSGANSGWTTTGQMSAPDYSQVFSNALDMKRVENETKTADSTVNLQNEQAKTENEKRINLQFDSMMKDAKKHMIDRETSWIDKEKNAQIYKYMQEAEQARAIASVQAYNADTARIVANAQTVSANASELSAKYGNPFRSLITSVREEGQRTVDDYLKRVKKDSRGVPNPWIYGY